MFDIHVKNYGVNLCIEIFSFIYLKKTRHITLRKYVFHLITTSFHKLFCNSYNGMQERTPLPPKKTEQKLKHNNTNKWALCAKTCTKLRILSLSQVIHLQC